MTDPINTDTDRKKGIRRTTIVLVVVALAFFFAFIAMGVVRA